MAAIRLPDGVLPREMEHRFVDAGGWQRGPLGGASVRLDRPGSHYAVKLSFPPAETRQTGRVIAARLIRAMREGLRVELPLGDFRPGAPGSPVVDGNGQAGTSLAIRGLTPFYAVREGQWFTHIRGDDAKLYNAGAQVIADAAGKAVISIEPELGIEPVDSDQLLFGKPVIQGIPQGNVASWTVALERLMSFEIDIEEMV